MVLCGGRGTRLGPLTDRVPKPLLLVDGQPFLLRLLLRLQQEGFRRFLLAAHYRADQFDAFRKSQAGLFPHLELSVEPEPLGTGGALRYAADRVNSSTMLVLNGDTLLEQNLAPVLLEHEAARRDFTVVAVQAEKVEGPARQKGVWRVGSAGEILGFDTRETVTQGWVNGGCYLLDRGMVNSWPTGIYRLEANVVKLLAGRTGGVYRSSGRLLDIGLPATYHRAAQLLQSYDH